MKIIGQAAHVLESTQSAGVGEVEHRAISLDDAGVEERDVGQFGAQDVLELEGDLLALGRVLALVELVGQLVVLGVVVAAGLLSPGPEKREW